MSAYVETRVEKPEYFKLAPLHRTRGKRRPVVIGFDSEADTRTGEPMLLQFSVPEHESEADTHLIRIGNRGEALSQFLAFVASYCTRKDEEYIIYGWNLAYEFTQLFGGEEIPEDTRAMDDVWLTPVDVIDPFTLDIWTFDLHVMQGKRHRIEIINQRTKRHIKVLDGMAFFKTSLNAAAKMLNLGEKFYDNSFDVSKITRADLDNEEFLRYSRQDAFITRKVGEHIVGMHEPYGVPTTMSAPHFASTVFRTKFLDGEIELPNPELEQFGLYSYHGGKNGLYLPDPTHVPDAWNYDITSAYPEAMRQLPDPVRSEWFKEDRYRPGIHAVVRATLRYRRCEYRGMMMFDGHWPGSAVIPDVFLTSYELDAMVEREEADILDYEAWRMEGPPGGALVHYVDEFFGMKARTTGPERETAKLFLNSLYGKFFQKVPLGAVGSLNITTGEWVVTDPESPFDWRAGGLYHPPIASLITGFVRARIHRLEHKYDALMTSTDGFFGMMAPDADDLGKHLGGLTASRGDLRIWRERLYVFRPDDGDKPKAAFHGFRGRADDPNLSTTENMIAALEAIPLAHGTYTYEGRQMVTLHMSTTDLRGERYEPGRFVTLPYQITI